MRNNIKKLLLALASATLLIGCEVESTKVNNGSDPIANANFDGNKVDAKYAKEIQTLYETLKASSGGSKAVESLIHRLSELEYGNLAQGKEFEAGSTFDVKQYRTIEKFNDDINEFFQEAIDSNSYNDEVGEFDAVAYRKSLESSYDMEFKSGKSTLIDDDDLATKLGYNYDELIKEHVIPEIYETYLYQDYVLASEKWVRSFSSQYAYSFEALKFKSYTNKEDAAFSTALAKVIKAVLTGNTPVLTEEEVSSLNFATTYADTRKGAIVTYDNNRLSYTEILSEGCELCYNNFYNRTSEALNLNDIEESNYQISKILDASCTNYWNYEVAEKIMIAKELSIIDRKVAAARDYDLHNAAYEAMTDTEKSNAKSYASTYSSSNTKTIKEGAKAAKVTAQNVQYYYELDTYTKTAASNILPSAISSLRGTSVKEMWTNLVNIGDVNYLCPRRTGQNDPVYLDGSNYWVVDVDNYYGLYLSNSTSYDKSATTKTVTHYQMESYRAGKYDVYELLGSSYSVKETNNMLDGSDTANKIIDLVQASVPSIVSSSSKKETIVSLFEKYGLEINDQDVYDYISGQYPDYFEEDE